MEQTTQEHSKSVSAQQIGSAPQIPQNPSIPPTTPPAMQNPIAPPAAQPQPQPPSTPPAMQNPNAPSAAQTEEVVYLDNFPKLGRDDMTNLVSPIYNPSFGEDKKCEDSPTGTVVTPISNLFPDAPLFSVPANPLLPPEYQETLDYNTLQYLNGFYRTQIGRYVRVEYQTTSSSVENIYGYLIGVGLNYILLQDAGTSNVIAIDSYSIKLFYVYYNYTGLL